VLNKAQYPSDLIAPVVLWRLRYKLSLRGLAEMFLTRGFIFTYEAVRVSVPNASTCSCCGAALAAHAEGRNCPAYPRYRLSGRAPRANS
jgi:hypothetical protein